MTRFSFVIAGLAGLAAATIGPAGSGAQETRAPVPFPSAGVTAPSALRILPATEVTLEQFRWQARLVVVLADSPAIPAYVEQMRHIEARPEALAERDVVVITDTEPAANSAVRQRLRPNGFALVLIDKDGQINQRKPLPWDVRELTRAIDKMPIRQEEIRSQRFGG